MTVPDIPVKDVIDLDWLAHTDEREPLYRAQMFQNRLHQHQRAVEFFAAKRMEAMIHLRHSDGWSAAEIADKLNMTRQQVYRLLGEAQPHERCPVCTNTPEAPRRSVGAGPIPAACPACGTTFLPHAEVSEILRRRSPA